MPQKLPFSMRREQDCYLPPFLFSQRVYRVPDELPPLSFSYLWGPCLFQTEFLLKSFVPGDFLTFICFYAAEVKESHVVSFFPKKKKVGRKQFSF
jgi:hypothetical protein